MIGGQKAKRTVFNEYKNYKSLFDGNEEKNETTVRTF